MSPPAGHSIYVSTPTATTATALTRTADAYDESPAWSPDGRKLCFFSNRDGDFDVYVMNPDGSNQVNLTNEHAQSDFECVWTRDGRRIVYRGANGLPGKIMDADAAARTSLAVDRVVIAGPTFSPNGSRLAFYAFDGSNNFGSIYVSDADGTDKVGAHHVERQGLLARLVARGRRRVLSPTSRRAR